MGATDPGQATVPLSDDELARERQRANNAIRAGADSAAVARRFRERNPGQELEPRDAVESTTAIPTPQRRPQLSDVTDSPGTMAIVQGLLEQGREGLETVGGAIGDAVRDLPSSATSPPPGFPEAPTLQEFQENPAGAGLDVGLGALEIALSGVGGPIAGKLIGKVGRPFAKAGRRSLRRPAKAERVARAVGPEGERAAARETTGPFGQLVKIIEGAGERITPEARRQLTSVEGRRLLEQAIPDAAQRAEVTRLVERGANAAAIRRILQFGVLGGAGRAAGELF